MGWLERLFGKRAGASSAGMTPNPNATDPLEFQALFPDALRLDWDEALQAVRGYHPSAANAALELDREIDEAHEPRGLFGWDRHMVQFLGLDTPLPDDAVERCIRFAPYQSGLKRLAQRHQSHVTLHYVGHARNPLDGYVALALVSGSLARLGAVVIVNERARTSFPASALLADAVGGDALQFLRALPLPLLYCGFAKMTVEGERGVWMRTYGAPRLGLPDLATRAEGHHQGQLVFDIYNDVLRTLLERDLRLRPGAELPVRPDWALCIRGVERGEEFLEADGEFWVADLVPRRGRSLPQVSDIR